MHFPLLEKSAISMNMDLLTQAKEDLQRERLLSQFRTILPWFLGVTAVVVIGVGGYEAYRGFSNMQNRKNTDALVAASNDSSLNALLEYAKEEHNAHGAMGALTAFARMSPEEQQKDGLSLLKSAATDGKLPSDWRAFAALVLVKAEIAFGAEASRADEFLALLRPAVTDTKNPWHALSSLESALIAGEMKNDPKAAAAFIDMDTKTLTPQLAQRVTMAQAHYGAGMDKPKE